MQRYKPVILVSVGVVLGLAIGAFGLIWASQGGSEVRIGATALGDGRVEVALQQRVDGEWNTYRPEARFLAADAEHNRTYWSTNVELAQPLAVTEPESAASVQTTNALPGPYAQGTVAAGKQVRQARADSTGLYCFISHGDPTDSFWRVAHSGAVYTGALLDINLRSVREADSADQAAAIRKCTAHGATIIATTLADPEVLRPAIEEAIEAGIYLATFNAGVEEAIGIGSRLHLAIDEAAAGRLAGEEFTKLGTSGNIVCVIHETANVSLSERCDALDAAYDGGEVVRLQIAGVDDPVQTIADAIDDETGGVLTLNSDSLRVAAPAVGDADVILGSIGSDVRIASQMPSQFRFSISDAPWQGAWVTVLAQEDYFASSFTAAFGVTYDTRVFVVRPSVFTREVLEAAGELFRQFDRRGGN